MYAFIKSNLQASTYLSASYRTVERKNLFSQNEKVSSQIEKTVCLFIPLLYLHSC